MDSKDSSTTDIDQLLRLIAEDRAESAPAPARDTADDGLHSSADQRDRSGELRHRESGHFMGRPSTTACGRANS
jgi:hypothetical protein